MSKKLVKKGIKTSCSKDGLGDMSSLPPKKPKDKKKKEKTR